MDLLNEAAQKKMKEKEELIEKSILADEQLTNIQNLMDTMSAGEEEESSASDNESNV